VVASISARGSATAALGYYAHLSADSYYTRGGEPPGHWAGAAAERLGLDGPVTRTEFDAALQGRDPMTGAALMPAISPKPCWYPSRKIQKPALSACNTDMDTGVDTRRTQASTQVQKNGANRPVRVLK
jgi:hypothetical protein